MIIKLPINLKLKLFFSKNNFYQLKILTERGVIKKKYSKKFIKMVIYKNSLLLVNRPFIGSFNILHSYYVSILGSIRGLFKLFKFRVILEGIGYKVCKKNNKLKLKVGFSSAILVTIPSGIFISIYKSKKLTVSSISKFFLKIFIHILRSVKVPDPYKKKGIRFYNERIKLKIGKKSNR